MISYHCDIKDLELSIGVRHVTSTMLKVVGKTDYFFFNIQPILLWMGMQIIQLCLLYTRLYCDTYQAIVIR